MKKAYEIGVVIENDIPEGRDPRKMTVEELNEMGHVKKPLLKAIREKCLDCSGQQPSEVAKCTAVRCPLWQFRMSKNPHHTVNLTDEQKAKRRDIMKKAREN